MSDIRFIGGGGGLYFKVITPSPTVTAGILQVLRESDSRSLRLKLNIFTGKNVQAEAIHHTLLTLLRSLLWG